MGKYKIALDLPDVLTGAPLEIPPVGIIENGSFVEKEMDELTASFLATGYGITVTGPEGVVPAGVFETVPTLPPLPPQEEEAPVEEQVVAEAVVDTSEGGDVTNDG